jgi:hypothetical protein
VKTIISYIFLKKSVFLKIFALKNAFFKKAGLKNENLPYIPVTTY